MHSRPATIDDLDILVDLHQRWDVAQFGAVEMGGMFSVVKVREGLAADDYKDPGWYQHPAGTVAYEVEGPTPPPARAEGARNTPATAPKVVKPRNGGHDHH